MPPWNDSNGNGEFDDIDSTTGFSQDCNQNLIQDECEPDCDGDGVPDECDPVSENDCNNDQVPGECQNLPDCNNNQTPDECENFADCNGNDIPDECGPDRNSNDVPVDCEMLANCLKYWRSAMRRSSRRSLRRAKTPGAVSIGTTGNLALLDLRPMLGTSRMATTPTVC